MIMSNLLHEFEPTAIAFSVGSIAVHWYGLMIVLGIIFGLAVLLQLVKKVGINKDEVYNLAFYLIIFSILGARIYAVFLELPYYLGNPSQIPAVWNGGLAIHGALIGGALTVWFYAKKKKQSFWQWADLIAVVIPLGQAFGRWGNYFNQELFGRPTELPWGIPIDLFNRPIDFQNFEYFHPTFLYESILNLINFIVLLVLFNRRQEFKLKTGSIFLVYIMNYSVIRIVMEFFRIDHTPEFFGVRVPIIVSLILFFVCLALILKKQKKFDA